MVPWGRPMRLNAKRFGHFSNACVQPVMWTVPAVERTVGRSILKSGWWVDLLSPLSFLRLAFFLTCFGRSPPVCFMSDASGRRLWQMQEIPFYSFLWAKHLSFRLTRILEALLPAWRYSIRRGRFLTSPTQGCATLSLILLSVIPA